MLGFLIPHKAKLLGYKVYNRLKLYKIIDFFYKLYDWIQPKVYGKAKFMPKHEMIERMNPAINKGICFSPYCRLSLEESCTGSLWLAKSGRGKTTRGQALNILECEGSMITIDAYDDEEKSLYHNTSGYKAKQGYKVKVICPDNPEISNCLNHLSYCYTTDDFNKVANFFIQSVKSDKSPMWHLQTEKALNLAHRTTEKSGEPDYFNEFNALWLIKNFAANPKSVKEFMMRTIHPSINPKDEELPDLWTSYLNLAGRSADTRDGILTTAEAALKDWDSMANNLCRITAKDDLELEKIREEKTIIYIRLKKTQIKTYSLFLNLFFSTCIRVFSKLGYKEGMLPMFFFLDEFGNLPAIDDFDSLVTTLRESKVSLNLAAQSEHQIVEKYGADKAETIISNLNARVYFGGSFDHSNQKISSALGDKTVQATVAPLTEEENTRTITTGSKLINPDEIRQLQPGEAIGIFDDKKPIRFRKMRRYFNYRYLAKRANIPPVPLIPKPVQKLKRIPFKMEDNPFTDHKLGKRQRLSRDIEESESKTINQAIPNLNLEFSQAVNSALGLA